MKKLLLICCLFVSCKEYNRFDYQSEFWVGKVKNIHYTGDKEYEIVFDGKWYYYEDRYETNTKECFYEYTSNKFYEFTNKYKSFVSGWRRAHSDGSSEPLMSQEINMEYISSISYLIGKNVLYKKLILNKWKKELFGDNYHGKYLYSECKLYLFPQMVEVGSLNIKNRGW